MYFHTSAEIVQESSLASLCFVEQFGLCKAQQLQRAGPQESGVHSGKYFCSTSGTSLISREPHSNLVGRTGPSLCFHNEVFHRTWVCVLLRNRKSGDAFGSPCLPGLCWDAHVWSKAGFFCLLSPKFV